VKVADKCAERLLVKIENSTKRQKGVAPAVEPLLDVVFSLDSEAGAAEVEAFSSLVVATEGQIGERGMDIPFLRSLLSPREILRIAERDECIHIDLNEVDISIVEPPVAVPNQEEISPVNSDVYRRVKKGILSELNGKGATIGILDTGYTPHRLIPDKVKSRNFTSEPDSRDDYGHGTFIQGQWLSRHKENKGLVRDVGVLSGKIFTKAGQTTLAWILSGCDWMLKENPIVVNESWGGLTEYKSISLANDALIDNNIIVVASAGNAGREDGSKSTISFPAAQKNVICVGAITKGGKLCSFSSTGIPGQGKPDMVSFGQDVVSIRANGASMGRIIDSDFVCASGTSFACPVVTAEVVMILEYYRRMNKEPPHARELGKFLKENCCRPFVAEDGHVYIESYKVKPESGKSRQLQGMGDWQGPHS